MTQRDGRITLFTRLITAPGAADPAPGSGPGPFARVRERARRAEAAGIDALLVHDRQSAAPDDAEAPYFEAGTLAAALAVGTTAVGLVASVSTQHALPYHAARILATVDHLAPGRAGWQPLIDADPEAAANYSRSGAVSESERRARAAEFVTVLTGLWDSFDDDAFLRDRESGVYFTPEKLHPLDHRGEYFDVAGPLNIGRPPQGHPVLVQRVRDADDLALAARVADVVLLPAQDGRDAAAVREALHAGAKEAGREAGDLAVLLDVPADGGPDTAGRIRALFASGAVDGFTLLAPAGPADAAHEAVLALVSELRAADTGGPSVPAGATLRARLGLPRPPGRHRTA